MTMFRSEMGYALLAGVALAVLLLALRPLDRASARNSLVLLGLAALAEVAGQAGAMGPAARVAGVLADAASILMGLVLLRLAAMVVFRVLLPMLRFATPRIVEDLVVTGLFVRLGPALVPHGRRRAGKPARHFGGDHRGARVLDEGHAGQRAGWRRAAARPVDPRRRLGEDGRRLGARGGDPLAAHGGGDAQSRDGRRAQQLAHDQSLHRDRLARRPAGRCGAAGCA